MTTRYLLRAALIAALLALLAPAPAAAQPAWRERATDHFLILYAEGGAAEAEAAGYAGFVDTLYEEIAAAFSFRAATPLTLRLYPTSEDYYAANPAARAVPGVVAHADYRLRELVVIVERTAAQGPVERENNIRHELTHIVAADLSAGRLNVGLQEGVAQYLERPSPDLDLKIAALARARDQGRLLPWAAFDDRAAIYSQPEVSYPQSLSVVAFLVERDGFARLRELLTISARSSGYRSAIERAYGLSATELEAAWLDWLPTYLGGDFRRSAVERYDLGYARALIAQGNYALAASELDQAIAWLAKNAATQPAELRAEAQALRDQAADGLRAARLAEAAQSAIGAGDYELAGGLIGQAEQIYAALGDERQAPVLAIYRERVARGLRAGEQLRAADALARGLDVAAARAAADAAAGEFAALGDDLRRDNALALRRSIDARQRTLGLALLAVGSVGLLLSLAARLLSPPREVW